MVAVGVVWNTRAAAGADAYGYVSQVDLWLSGSLHIDQRFGEQALWPLVRWTFTPLGYRPEPDGFRIVPTYSPGLPMLMAAAKFVVGQCAMFWIVPLAGGALTFATYLIGCRMCRPWVGLGAAWFVATSPAMLFMLMAPMSDVPAAAAWAVAVAFALSEQPIAAFGAGIAAAVAILIRPNLVPLAAIIAVWLVSREDFAGRQRGAARLLAFAAPAAASAIVIALVNTRLYGSALMSGYGDLSDAYAWSYAVPNLLRYSSWLMMAETPLAVAGLAALVAPSRRLWTTPASRRAHWLLAAVAAAVWLSYVVYVPWDAWWYLRFLMPAWPMMAIGMASLVATLCADSPGDPAPRQRVVRAVLACAVVVFGVLAVRRAIQLNVFNQQSAEAKYLETANAVEAVTSPNDVIISGQFSGSLRYYAGRLTLRWDWLDPQWLDRAVAWFNARGHHVYILLEAPEVDPFRARFAGANAIGKVDWVPLVTFRGRSIQLHDAINRDRFERPIEQTPLVAIRECPPQKPFPSLR